MTYTAHLSNDGAFYAKDGKPCTREEFDAALNAMAKTPAATHCEWRVDDVADDAYLPSCCNTLWSRYRDTPKEDRYAFCPSCGKPIKFEVTQ